MAVDAAPPWRARERAIEDLLPGSMSHDRDLLLARLEEYARAVIATVRAERESGSCTPVRECMWLERPVFICGAHRSGTTLMQSLLDGHPELIVLPSEGTYLTSFAYAARERPSVGDVDRFIAEWIARLIDPILRSISAAPYCTGTPGCKQLRRHTPASIYCWLWRPPI
jgi:hypothetical protein